MEAERQAATHVPQPWHSPLLTRAVARGFRVAGSMASAASMALNGQTSLQRRQATQFCSSTQAIIGSDKRCGFENRSTTLAAAPDAWATVSGMSFGYWHAPAR